MSECKESLLRTNRFGLLPYPVIGWMVLLTSAALFFIFPGAALYEKWGIALPIYQGVVTVIVVVTYALSTLMNPGIVPRPSEKDAQSGPFRHVEDYLAWTQLNRTPLVRFCAICHMHQGKTVVHCNDCDACIED